MAPKSLLALSLTAALGAYTAAAQEKPKACDEKYLRDKVNAGTIPIADFECLRGLKTAVPMLTKIIKENKLSSSNAIFALGAIGSRDAYTTLATYLYAPMRSCYRPATPEEQRREDEKTVLIGALPKQMFFDTAPPSRDMIHWLLSPRTCGYEERHAEANLKVDVLFAMGYMACHSPDSEVRQSSKAFVQQHTQPEAGSKLPWIHPRYETLEDTREYLKGKAELVLKKVSECEGK